MAKRLVLRVEIFETHDDKCSGTLPDRCNKLSVSGQTFLPPDTREVGLQDLAAPILTDTLRRFEETREAWDRADGAD